MFEPLLAMSLATNLFNILATSLYPQYARWTLPGFRGEVPSYTFLRLQVRANFHSGRAKLSHSMSGRKCWVPHQQFTRPPNHLLSSGSTKDPQSVRESSKNLLIQDGMTSTSKPPDDSTWAPAQPHSQILQNRECRPWIICLLCTNSSCHTHAYSTGRHSGTVQGLKEAHQTRHCLFLRHTWQVCVEEGWGTEKVEDLLEDTSKLFTVDNFDKLRSGALVHCGDQRMVLCWDKGCRNWMRKIAWMRKSMLMPYKS